MESVTLSELESFLEPDIDSYGESEIDPREGIIFDPADEETIYLLKAKAWHPDFDYPPIYEANIYDYEPYELRAIESDGNLYFFCRLIPLDASGEKYSRVTRTGTWKVTCRSFIIKDKHTHEDIGVRRTLVFYKSSPGCPKGVRTNWMMYEYSAFANNNPLFKDLVLCRIKEDKEKEKKDNKKRCIISAKNEDKPAKKRLISTNDVIQPEQQLPPGCNLFSDPRSDAAEYTNPEWNLHSVLVSNVINHAVEDASQEDTLPLENLNVPNGPTRLDETSFFAQTQSTILREQGTSFSRVSSIENEVLNSSRGIESQREDCLQEWELVALDEFLNEETGYTKGFCGGDSSNVGTEIFNAWVDEALWNNNLGACVSHI